MKPYIFLSILLLAISTNSFGGAAKEINDIYINKQKLDSVESCLKKAIEKENIKMNKIQITFLLFDEVSKRPAEYQKTDVKTFCESIVNNIKGPIKKEIKKSEYDDLGSAGEGFVIKNALLKYFFQKNYEHFEGHSNFTRRGFKRFFKNRCEGCINSTAEELIIRGSQAPDLYHWKDESFHAHTTKETNNVDESQKLYFCQIQELITNSKNKIKDYRFTDALIYFGEVLHMLQDLIFHQGMTMTEHSVRSFLEHDDPDQPSNENKKRKLFYDAEQITFDALNAFENRLDNKTQWEFIMSLQKPSLDIENKIDTMLGNYDFTTLNILAYWSLHLPYTINGVPLINLQYDKYRWDISEVKQTSLSIINGSKKISDCP